MSDRISQKDIAKAVGVSVATVSMALAGDQRVSAATRKAVREAADRLGYVSDPRLASIASGRFRHSGKPIRIAISSEGPEWAMQLRPQAEVMGMTVRQIDGPVAGLVGLAMADEASALIISRRGVDAAALADAPLPVVLWGDEGPDDVPVDRVETVDWWTATTGAIERVQAAGFRRPAAVLTPATPRHWHDDLRMACIQAHGIPVMEFAFEDDPVLAFLERHHPDSLIIGLSMVAQVLERHQRRIPLLSLIVIDNEWERSYTGWVADQDHCGQVTLELIEQRLRYGPRPPRRVVVPPRWQIGKTLQG